jgi:hypothetical protein
MKPSRKTHPEFFSRASPDVDSAADLTNLIRQSLCAHSYGFNAPVLRPAQCAFFVSTRRSQTDMNGGCEQHVVRRIDVLCHRCDIRQVQRGADSDIRFSLRVHRLSRQESLGHQN